MNSEKHHDPTPHASLEDLQEFVRTSRSRIVPERVAEMIGRQIEPVFQAHHAVELFAPLVDDLRKRLEERGISLPFPPNLQRTFKVKEQRMLAALSLLQTELARGLLYQGKVTDIDARIEEALNVARAIGDHWKVGVALDMMAGFEYASGEHAESLRILEEVERLGHDHGYADLVNYARHHQTSIHRRNGDFPKAIEIGKALLASLGDTPRERHLKIAVYNLLAISQMVGNLQDALASANAAIDMLDHDNWEKGSELFVLRSEILYRMGELHEAFAGATEGLELAERRRDDIATGRLHRLLGKLHERFGEIDEALAEYEQSRDVFARMGWHEERIQTDILYATLLIEGGRHEQGWERCREILEWDRSLKSEVPERNSRVLVLMGDACMKGERLVEAESYYSEGLAICRNNHLTAGSCETLARLGKLYHRTGRNPEAIKAFEEALAQPGMESREELRIEIVGALADLHEEKRSYRKAFAHLRTAHDLTKELKDRLLDEKFNRMRVEHGIREYQARLAEERTHRGDIEKQLSALQIAFIEKTELLESIRRRLPEMASKIDASERGAMRKELRNMMHEIRKFNREEPTPKRVNGQNPDRFQTELRRRHPDLSPGQIKLCGLIRSGLDGHDITHTLHITFDSLMKRRYRLRRSLGLKREESLEKYLAGMGVEG